MAHRLACCAPVQIPSTTARSETSDHARSGNPTECTERPRRRVALHCYRPVRLTSSRFGNARAVVAAAAAGGPLGAAAGEPAPVVCAAMGTARPEGELRVEGDAEFEWEKNWYPAAVVRDLDPLVPAPLTLLGIPLVLWFHAPSKQWRAFKDACPHRLAPLSEGRIHSSGALQCSYHGWTFGAEGGCTGIPQAEAKQTGKPLSSSPRACAVPFPSCVRHGILFVWPDASPHAAALAAQSPVPVLPELEDPAFTGDVVMTDLQYGYEMLVENLVDPAHVPFAHHKIMSNRKFGKPLDLKVHAIRAAGIEGENNEGNRFHFLPPTLIRQEIIPKPKEGQPPSSPPRKLVLAFYCIPTSPGRSRLIFSFPANFFPPVLRLLPRFLSHLGQMTILDSDHYLLHVLERRLEEEKVLLAEAAAAAAALNPSSSSSSSSSSGARVSPSTNQIYFTPTRSDAFVSAFRFWLDSFAGGAVKWPPHTHTGLPTQALTKAAIMDRQLSHVSQCRSCQSAQLSLSRLRTALWAAAFLCLALLALLPAIATTSRVPTLLAPLVRPAAALPLFLLSGLLALAAQQLGAFLERTFVAQGYVHALVD